MRAGPNPGEFVQSDLAANLRASVDDPVGDRLRSRTLTDAKAGGNDVDLQSPQMRDIGRDFPPAHPAMKRQQSDFSTIGRLPAGIDKTDTQSPASATQVPKKKR